MYQLPKYTYSCFPKCSSFIWECVCHKSDVKRKNTTVAFRNVISVVSSTSSQVLFSSNQKEKLSRDKFFYIYMAIFAFDLSNFSKC